MSTRFRFSAMFCGVRLGSGIVTHALRAEGWISLNLRLTLAPVLNVCPDLAKWGFQDRDECCEVVVV
jgi:hypothetical protein